MKPAICMEMLYPGAAPEEKIRRIAGHGFRHIEFWGHGDKDIDALVRVCAETGVSVVNFSGNRKGDLIDSATHEIIISEIRESVGVARRLGTRTLMVLSNELGEGGKVVHSLNRLHADEKRANLIAGLVSLMREVPRDMTITLEPLNTVLDHAGNFLAGTRQAEEIVGEIGDSRLKILCDFYHMALMGEYPPDTAKKYAHYIGHVHIADYPGRHEPGTGHGPWKETLLVLREKSYAGYVGFEFSPAADSDASLEAVSKLWRTTFGEQTLN